MKRLCLGIPKLDRMEKRTEEESMFFPILFSGPLYITQRSRSYYLGLAGEAYLDVSQTT